MNPAITDLMDLLPIHGPPAKESMVAAAIREKLIEIGIPASNITHDKAQDQSEYGGEVGNMIVQINGRPSEPRLMFSTHMDTVPIAVGCQPRLDVENNRVVNAATIRRSRWSFLFKRRLGWWAHAGWI